MPVLSQTFNKVVRYFGGMVPCTFTSRQYATFEDMRADYQRTGRIAINVDNSDNTIFGSPEVNWLFRAWHDYCHVMVNGGFDRPGELAAMRLMCDHISAHSGLTDAEKALCMELVRIEVKGQVDYYLATGMFPENQFDFGSSLFMEGIYRNGPQG